MPSIAKMAAKIVGHQIVGAVEYFCFPDRRDSWGGPFNGQIKRQELFLCLTQTCRPAAIVETGTYRGTSTAFIAASHPQTPIFSVEKDPRHFSFSKMRLHSFRNVRLSRGESRSFLKGTPSRAEFAQKTALFYLDAHWGEDLPLSDELDIIFSSFPRSVVMIDDFEVPGDEGYKFDDYGPGKALTASYIEPHVKRFNLSAFYPTTPSTEETGARRGCVVLVSDTSLAEAVTKGGCCIRRVGANAKF